MEQDVVEPNGAGRAGVKPAPAQATVSKTGAEEQAARDAQLTPERESKMGDYFRIFSYAKAWDFPLMAAGALAAIGSGVTMPLMNVVFGRLVNTFNSYFANDGASQSQADFYADIDQFSLYIFGLFIARFGLIYISKFAVRIIGIRMSAGIRLHYLTCLFAQTIHVLDSMPPGAAAGTITTAANTLQLGISEKLATFVEYLATIVASMVVAFSTNWALTLVTASVILFIALVISIFLPFIIRGQERQTEAETKASSIASETFSSIRMVTACGAEARMAQRFNVWAETAQRHGQRSVPFLALQFGFIFFAMFAAFGLAFWYGTKSYAEGRVNDVGEVVVVLMSVVFMVVSLQQISTPLIAVSKAMVAATQFFVVIDAPRPDRGELKGPDVSATHDIEFRGVDFAYPSRPHVKVLDGLDLTIPAGKLTAIVGPSGSGKSTIVGLIERWYTLRDQHVIAKTAEPSKDKAKDKKKKKKDTDADKTDDEGESAAADAQPEETGPAVELKGSISTGGHELDKIDLKWWRSQIGLVQQEPFLFNDTIFKNVAHGLIGSAFEHESAERQRELVVEACREAFADEFIDRLPLGYETMVGESGTKLSGGQRQRISIARAVIKKPTILILDEATSAIDVRGEKVVQAALDKVSQGRTTITIAHRLSTIRKADNILVLKKGKVAEQGTHESLLEDENGVYYGLVHAQKLSLGEPSAAAAAADDSDGADSDEAAAVLSREKSAPLAEGAATGPAPAYKPQGFVKSFGRLLYEQKSWFPVYAGIVVAAMCTAAAQPLQSWLFAQIIVIFQLASDGPASPNIARFTSEANFWSLMWLMLAIGVGVAYFVLGYLASHLAHFISATYRKQYFEGLLYQRTAFFDEEGHSTGTLTALVGGDPKQLEEMLGLNMAMVYNAAFTLVGSMAIAFAFGWKLALVATFVTMPLGLLAGYFRFRYELEFEKLNSAVFAESSKFAAEAIGAFRTVSSMTLEDTIAARYEALLREHTATAFRKARLRTLVFAFSDSISLGCQALIFWYGGQLLATREYQAVNFFVCYMAVITGAENAGQGFSFGPNMAQAAAAANRILAARATRNPDAEKACIPDGEKACIPDAEGGVRLELRDVHFKYPTRDVAIFKGLNLSVEKGQFAALVGASGCGKTSIVSLLERFYELPRGQILANGVDIAGLNVYEWRRHLSLVAQEPNIFQGTLRENLLLGVADPAAVDDATLHAVCRDASIHDFIVSLPDGYNTEVGSRGVSLSGGQKQRLAIARALIRRPRVLLLDEATSSLDSESERLVQAAFERAARGRTMVVVAHRLATVQNADVIFVLGEGRVLEQGSHADLLKRRGVYWNMCQSQALDR